MLAAYDSQHLTDKSKAEGLARERKLVSQMGIQIHSDAVHRTVVALIQGGAIGKVREVHSWSNKQWGDRNPRPERRDAVPANLNWDHWLGVAADRPFIKDYYHPAAWRKHGPSCPAPWTSSTSRPPG